MLSFCEPVLVNLTRLIDVPNLYEIYTNVRCECDIKLFYLMYCSADCIRSILRAPYMIHTLCDNYNIQTVNTLKSFF